MGSLDITVNMDGLEGFKELLKKVPDIVMEETFIVMDDIAKLLEGKVVEKTPKGVGGNAGLMGSIHGGAVKYGEGVQAIIGTSLEYGKVIEYGRRPGTGVSMEGQESIALWAKKKWGLSDKKAKSAAYAIARKITLHGMKAVHMFEETLKEYDAEIMKEINSIPKRVVKRVIA